MTSHVSSLFLTSPGLIVPSTGFFLAKAHGLNSGNSNVRAFRRLGRLQAFK